MTRINGDQNTTYFHRFATTRRKRNFIKQLKADSGVVVEEPDQLQYLAMGYFNQIFTSEVQDPNQEVIDKAVP